MTERGWLRASDPYDLINGAGKLIGSRRLRLFGHACCEEFSRFWTAHVRAAAAVAQAAADKAATRSELAAARASLKVMNLQDAAGWSSNSIHFLCAASPSNAAKVAYSTCAEAAVATGRGRDEFRAATVALLRHVGGNPFRPPARPAVSADVKRLAEALYLGEECHFALADALLDEGEEALAAHFREPGHPPGCRLLDAILGKK